MICDSIKIGGEEFHATTLMTHYTSQRFPNGLGLRIFGLSGDSQHPNEDYVSDHWLDSEGSLIESVRETLRVHGILVCENRIISSNKSPLYSDVPKGRTTHPIRFHIDHKQSSDGVLELHSPIQEHPRWSTTAVAEPVNIIASIRSVADQFDVNHVNNRRRKQAINALEFLERAETMLVEGKIEEIDHCFRVIYRTLTVQVDCLKKMLVTLNHNHSIYCEGWNAAQSRFICEPWLYHARLSPDEKRDMTKKIDTVENGTLLRKQW